MGQINYTFYILLNVVLPVAVTGVFVWAFIDAVARPPRQFALASQSKNFWLAMLGGGTLAYAAMSFLHIYLPLAGFIRLALFIAVGYYLGPERSKMGPGAGRGRGPQRGSW